jgi:HAE1 family hydrophobic/amphiphilic exporter-1
VFGIFGYRLLSVAALPAVDFPTIQITATLPGASPETMGASVAGPIERQLSTIAGITSLTSTSSLGQSTIIIQFDLNRNIDGAALDVQTALTVAARRLPIEMTIPPFFRKVNPGDFAILLFSLVSPTLPLSVVDDYAEITLAQQISQLPGIAQVLAFGAQKFAVRVQVDPEAAAARGISLDDVRNVVAKANSNTPVGTIAGRAQNTTITASAAMRHADEYKDVVVAYRNGLPIKISAVAKVVDSVENDVESIVLATFKQPDANTVKIVDSIRERLPIYRAQIPAAVKMEILADRSMSIRESVEDVQVTLLIAIGLVVLVIFLFLRSAVATVIPALAVPISLIATCAAMYGFGFSINNMTLLALTLSVGFVVDDAIVMLENATSRAACGRSRRRSRVRRKSASPSFRFPVLLMGGMVGRVFREFAVTIAVAIILSGFVITLTPMLCARVLKGHEGESQNVVLRIFEAMFRSWLRGYEVSLDLFLKYKPVVIVAMLATLVGTVWLYMIIPKGFFPTEDTGFVSATVEGPSDISFKAMYVRQEEVAELLRTDPGVDYINSTVGAGGPNPTNNNGRLFIALKPRSERNETSTAIIQRLRAKANSLTGVQTFFQNVQNIQNIQNINITGRISKSEYQYTMQSSDIPALYGVGPDMLEKIQKLPGLRDVTGDLYVKNPQMTLDIDRMHQGSQVQFTARERGAIPATSRSTTSKSSSSKARPRTAEGATRMPIKSAYGRWPNWRQRTCAWKAPNAIANARSPNWRRRKRARMRRMRWPQGRRSDADSGHFGHSGSARLRTGTRKECHGREQGS